MPLINLLEDEKTNFSLIDKVSVLTRKDRKRTYEDIRNQDTVKACLKEFGKGMSTYILSNGGFSIIDLIVQILEKIGPARIDISTWTARNADIRKAHELLESDKIMSCRFLFDLSFKQRQPEFYANTIERFGKENVKQTRLHAKLYLIRNRNWHITILTSANLNNNTRAEYFPIHDDKELYNFNRQWFDAYFA